MITPDPVKRSGPVNTPPDDADVPPDDELTSPYGPQHGRVDEAAGGADSSPLDNVATGEQKEEARERKRRVPDTPGEAEQI